MLLGLAALVLGLTHFTVPLSYYEYLKGFLKKPWGLKIDEEYSPSLSVIVPTYNESAIIEGRLEDIKNQSYSVEKLDIVVVDSASVDSTVDVVREWISRNPDVGVELVEEPVRKGKASALNTGLKHVNGDIVVLADADSLWDRFALREALKYFSDPSVGAVTSIKEPSGTNRNGYVGIELTYRSFYNTIRVAESKIHSTPVFNGEFAAFRRDLLIKMGGFSSDIGADDSHAATLMALGGHRAIAVPEAQAFELVPRSRKFYFAWRVRRAKHLIQHFSKALKWVSRAPSGFRGVLFTESFLHLVNPWILVSAFVALAASFFEGPTPLNVAIILAVAAILAVKRTRKIFSAWILNQAILAYSAISSIWSKELVWRKIDHWK